MFALFTLLNTITHCFVIKLGSHATDPAKEGVSAIG
jgi:hypothetical protein